MLKTVFNKKIMVILFILIMFLAIPNVFAEDSAALDDLYSGQAVSDLNLQADDGDTLLDSNANAGVVENSQSNDFDSNLGNYAIAADGSLASDESLAIVDESLASDGSQVIADESLAADGSLAIADESLAIAGDDELVKTKELCSDGTGNTYYVNGEKGNDAAATGTFRNPFKTIAAALNKSVDGDTIFIMNGVYELNNLKVQKNITFIGESQENAILSGNKVNRIMELNATDVTLNNLTFVDGHADKTGAYNGGAIQSSVGGYLNIYNCTFLNNYGDTHGGAINIMPMTSTVPEKLVDVHVNVIDSTFIHNVAYHRYGGAFHIYDAYTYVNVYFNAKSCIFINNTDMNYDGYRYETTLSILSSNSTYLNVSDCVFASDSSYLVSDRDDGLRNYIHYTQSTSRGVGTAYADGNWWGDNSNPNDFNRTNFNITNWIVMDAAVAKAKVVATLATLEDIEGNFYEYDSSALPTRMAIYSPSNLFAEEEVEVIGGVASNDFIGEPPQDVSVTIDFQTLTVPVNDITGFYWYIDDAGYETLSEAVEAAQDGDTIKGVPNIYTSDLITEDIIIDKDLTITKMDGYAGDYILLKSVNSRVFNVAADVNLNLSNLIFENGGALDGGLIYVNSGASLTVSDSIFRKAENGLNGGAIYSEGEVSIENTKFTNIKAASDGGAIYAAADLSIVNSTFEDIESSRGGAIYASGESLLIDHSSFENSKAAIAGAIYSDADYNLIEYSKFVDNFADENYDIIYAENSFYADYNIFVENPVNEVVDVYVNDETDYFVSYNYWGTNNKPDSSKTNLDSDAWVILKLDIDANLDLISVNTYHNISIDFNLAYDGEEEFEIIDIDDEFSGMPSFSFNIKSVNGTLNQSKLDFDGTSSATIRYTTPSQLGSDMIYISSYGDQNLSFNVRTPVIYYWYIDDIGYETLQDAVDAADDGDIIEGVRFTHIYDTAVEIDKNLTIKSRDSQARASFDGRSFNDSALLHIAPDVSLQLIDLSYVGFSGEDLIGVIHNEGDLTITNNVFNRNTASAISNDGELKIISSTFTYNQASNGIIYNDGEMIIVDSSFTNNSATNGGAIYNDGKLIVDNSIFIDNKAEKNGGAILSTNESDIDNSLFLSNAASIGGAIYSSEDDSLSVDYSIFDGNDGAKGIVIAGVNMALDHNYWGSMDYENLIYNLSSGDSIEPYTDFRYVITGPEEVGIGESVEFSIELYSIDGDVSQLADYNVTLSTKLNNTVDIAVLNINQGKTTLNYIASSDIGEDYILLSDLSGAVGLFNFNVTTLDTCFELENISAYYGNGSLFVIYLKDSKGNALTYQDVVLSLGEEQYGTKTDNLGRVQINLNNYDIGTYEGNISFEGNEKYLACFAEFSFEILLIPTEIQADDMNVFYDDGSKLEITLLDVLGDSIFDKELAIVILDNESNPMANITNLTNSLGKIIIPLEFNPGNYTVDISFAGYEFYDGSNKSININVDKMPTEISANNLIIYYSDADDLLISLLDNNGNPIPDAVVNLKIFDLLAEVIAEEDLITNISGGISKTISYDIGEYGANITYLGDDFYCSSSSSSQISVVKMPTALSVNTIIARAYEENDLTGFLKDINGMELSDKDLIIEIINNGDGSIIDSYNLSTSDDGKFTQTIVLAEGTYTVKFTFQGNEKYENTSIDLVLNVLPSNSAHIDADDVLMSYNDGSIIAYLKNPAGDPIIGELLSFEIDGKIIQNLTDFDGKAVAAVDAPVGEYTVSIRFDGNDEYDACVKTIELKVLDEDSDVVNHTGNDALDIQQAIDNANPGDIIYLGDYNYTNVSNINITKNITIDGNGASIASAGDGNPIFNILPVSSGVEELEVTGVEFIVNDGDTLFKATAENGTSPLTIDTPAININGILLIPADDETVASSITVLELDSERGVLSPSREIKVLNNTFISGVDPFKFIVNAVLDGSDVDVPVGGGIIDKLTTEIICQNMTTNAINTVLDGRNGEYFNFKLVDSNGNALANKPIVVGFNGHVYNYTTDENGSAKTQINLGVKGGYTFAVSFLGDESYNASFAVAKITVNPEPVKLTTAKKTYKASAKTKTLTATFKTSRGTAIKGKKITFTVNKKTYTASTNAKGVATVKVSLSKKGTYSFTAKFAGDERYAAVSVKSTVKIS